jgi:hypothetical protein
MDRQDLDDAIVSGSMGALAQACLPSIDHFYEVRIEGGKIQEGYPSGPNSYEAVIRETLKYIARLHSMTPVETTDEAMASYKAYMKYLREARKKDAALRTKAISMLAAVELWKPAKKFLPLKSLMLEQLRHASAPSNLPGLASVPPPNGAAWLEQSLCRAEAQLASNRDCLKRQKTNVRKVKRYLSEFSRIFPWAPVGSPLR